ncbi:hypothetical protein TNCV_2263191 [Trichonephila clavipes]|nr:hypothetical protein TNCV_2263191 [Trichonephila clavipes]
MAALWRATGWYKRPYISEESPAKPFRSVISRFKKVAEGGNALRSHAEGQSRYTTPLEDRYVALGAKWNRNFTPGRIAANLATATGMHVSARTISRQLNQDALGRCVAQRTIPPCTDQELKTALRSEWDNIPQGFLDS